MKVDLLRLQQVYEAFAEEEKALGQIIMKLGQKAGELQNEYSSIQTELHAHSVRKVCEELEQQRQLLKSLMKVLEFSHEQYLKCEERLAWQEDVFIKIPIEWHIWPRPGYVDIRPWISVLDSLF